MLSRDHAPLAASPLNVSRRHLKQALTPGGAVPSIARVKLVTVILPVHDAEAYVAEAIESILGQTCADFELLVIDDGSTDRSVEVVQGYRDPRVRLLRNPENIGISATLNRGLDAATGVYVARMDADDVSLPERLQKQVDFLDRNPDIGLAGAGMELFGAAEGAVVAPRADPDAVASSLPFFNPICHPSVMMRASVFREAALRYDPSFPHAEDYELWTRAARATRLANLPEILIRYRKHAAAVSAVHRAAQRATTGRIRRRELAALGIDPSAAEDALHAAIAALAFQAEPGHVEEVERWLLRLGEANRAEARYPRRAFARRLGEYWLSAGRFAVERGVMSRARALASPLMEGIELTPYERAAWARAPRRAG